MSEQKLQFIGVGVGPGDPELITLKAARYIQQADVISFIANSKGDSQAKTIAQDVIDDAKASVEFLPVVMPMCDDRSIANAVYDEAVEKIKTYIQQGKQVVFICEGDPLFFGSFTYLLTRLRDDYRFAVVPGISSVHAASAQIAEPLTVLKESYAVISGRHTEQQMTQCLNDYDTVVIMKAGKSRPKILSALATSGRTAEAKYLEYVGRQGELIVTDVTQLENTAGPYFSLFIITRSDRGMD